MSLSHTHTHTHTHTCVVTSTLLIHTRSHTRVLPLWLLLRCVSTDVSATSLAVGGSRLMRPPYEPAIDHDPPSGGAVGVTLSVTQPSMRAHMLRHLLEPSECNSLQRSVASDLVTQPSMCTCMCHQLSSLYFVTTSSTRRVQLAAAPCTHK